MTTASEWRGGLGQVWAEEWRLTDQALAPVNDRLVERLKAEIAGDEQPKILDVGCGAGSTSLAVANRLPGAQVTGIDLSEPLIATARQRERTRDGLSFAVADASAWRESSGFDALVSRHGVMFFDDPVAAFRNLAALAAPGAPLVFSCFRARDENGWYRVLEPIIAEFGTVEPEPPVGPFAFAAPNRVLAILDAAGFERPRTEPFDFAYVAGSGQQAREEALAFLSRIGPAARLLRTLEPGRQDAARARLAAIIDSNCADGRVSLDAAAWIVTAYAPSARGLP